MVVGEWEQNNIPQSMEPGLADRPGSVFPKTELIGVGWERVGWEEIEQNKIEKM